MKNLLRQPKTPYRALRLDSNCSRFVILLHSSLVSYTIAWRNSARQTDNRWKRHVIYKYNILIIFNLKNIPIRKMATNSHRKRWIDLNFGTRRRQRRKCGMRALRNFKILVHAGYTKNYIALIFGKIKNNLFATFKSGCHKSHCLAIVVRMLLNAAGSQTAISSIHV